MTTNMLTNYLRLIGIDVKVAKALIRTYDPSSPEFWTIVGSRVAQPAQTVQIGYAIYVGVTKELVKQHKGEPVDVTKLNSPSESLTVATYVVAGTIRSASFATRIHGGEIIITPISSTN